MDENTTLNRLRDLRDLKSSFNFPVEAGSIISGLILRAVYGLVILFLRITNVDTYLSQLDNVFQNSLEEITAILSQTITWTMIQVLIIKQANQILSKVLQKKISLTLKWFVAMMLTFNPVLLGTAQNLKYDALGHSLTCLGLFFYLKTFIFESEIKIRNTIITSIIFALAFLEKDTGFVTFLFVASSLIITGIKRFYSIKHCFLTLFVFISTFYFMVTFTVFITTINYRLSIKYLLFYNFYGTPLTILLILILLSPIILMSGTRFLNCLFRVWTFPFKRCFNLNQSLHYQIKLLYASSFLLFIAVLVRISDAHILWTNSTGLIGYFNRLWMMVVILYLSLNLCTILLLFLIPNTRLTLVEIDKTKFVFYFLLNYILYYITILAISIDTTERKYLEPAIQCATFLFILISIKSMQSYVNYVRQTLIIILLIGVSIEILYIPSFAYRYISIFEMITLDESSLDRFRANQNPRYTPNTIWAGWGEQNQNAARLLQTNNRSKPIILFTDYYVSQVNKNKGNIRIENFVLPYGMKVCDSAFRVESLLVDLEDINAVFIFSRNVEYRQPYISILFNDNDVKPIWIDKSGNRTWAKLINLTELYNFNNKVLKGCIQI